MQTGFRTIAHSRSNSPSFCQCLMSLNMLHRTFSPKITFLWNNSVVTKTVLVLANVKSSTGLPFHDIFSNTTDVDQSSNVRLSHELLQEKPLVSAVYQVLYWVIDKDALLNRSEIEHTRFWIPIVNIKITLCWVDCTPNENTWGVSHLYQW